MRLHFAVLVLALSLALFSCSKAKVGVNTYDIPYSESVTFDQGKKLTFHELIDDSRCPSGVQCVWGGKATVEFRAVSTPNDTVFFELTIGDVDPELSDTIIFDIYHIELLEVLPLPIYEEDVDIENYSVRVLIEKT